MEKCGEGAKRLFLHSMMIGSAIAVALVLATALSATAGCPPWNLFNPPPFQGLATIAAGHDVSDLVFADLGNDGDLDLVTVSSAQASFGVNVHVNDNGYLAPFAVTGDRPSAVALADLNGDGRLDILITEQAASLQDCRAFGSCQSLTRVLADANGGFTGGGSTTPIPYIESVRRIVAADFNKDGNVDVLVAGAPIAATDPSLHLLWGGTPGTGLDGTIQTFTPNGPIGDVVLGDFDNDTFIDFVAAVGQAGSEPQNHVDVYRNNAGTFTGVTDTQGIKSVHSNMRLVAAHFTADQHLDAGVSIETTTERVDGSGAEIARGDTEGGLMNGGRLTLAPRAYHDLAAGDFDEDNDLDVIVAGGNLALLYNPGNGFLSNFREINATNARRIFSADFDMDGRTDLAYLDHATDNVQILGNTCSSRYIAQTLSSSPNPSTFGGSVTFTASFTVKPNAPVPTGTVTFKDGATVLGTATINDAGNAFLTVNDLAVGSHTVIGSYDGDPSNGYGPLHSNNLVHTVARPPFGAPLNIVATGNAAANTITIRWVSTADVGTNQILRRDDLGQWSTIGSTSNEQFTDSNVVATRAYVYTVRSLHATNGTISPNGNLDLGTTINPVRPSDKIIRAADTNGVRSLAQSLRRSAGLANFTFTDATLTGLPTKAVHLTELRTAIAQARAVLGLPGAALSQPTITPKVTRVKFNDLQELRTSFY
jgi:hypothetical protein